MTPAGDLLIIEFKTGPQNPYHRHALAQLLDDASDLWQMDPSDFATNVVVTYLATRHCPTDDPARGATTLRDAATRTWPTLDIAELDAFEANLARRLSAGRFHLVLAAQCITRNLRSTIEFLQQSEAKVNFHAVELVKFTDDGRTTMAYEGRAVTTPAGRRGRGATGGSVDVGTVLGSFDDPAHRERLETLIEYCRGLQLTFEAGSKGLPNERSGPSRAGHPRLGLPTRCRLPRHARAQPRIRHWHRPQAFRRAAVPGLR